VGSKSLGYSFKGTSQYGDMTSKSKEDLILQCDTLRRELPRRTNYDLSKKYMIV